MEAGRGWRNTKNGCAGECYEVVGGNSIDEGPLSLSVTRRRRRWACWVTGSGEVGVGVGGRWEEFVWGGGRVDMGWRFDGGRWEGVEGVEGWKVDGGGLGWGKERKSERGVTKRERIFLG